MKNIILSENEIITLKTALQFEDVPKYICAGKNWKQFKNLASLKLIHFDTLKFTGVIRLTNEGREYIKNINQ